MPVGDRQAGFKYANFKKGRVVIKEDNVLKEYGYVEGHLTDIQIVDDEYKDKKFKKLCLTINDGIDEFRLQMRLDSGYGRAFCCIIPNCDVLKPMMISPNMEVKDDKEITGMYINQDNKPVKWAFTRENSGERPDLEKVTFKGEEHWDNTKQQAFYIDLLLNKIKPLLPHAAVAGPVSQASNTINPAADEGEGAVDDLPF